MRILVTGGAGFIGSHLCERLLRENHRVSVVDNFDDFYAFELKQRNVQEMLDTGPVDVRVADICDSAAFDAVVKSCRPEVVIHLAARAGVRRSIADPFMYERVNIQGTLSVLEACRRNAVGRVIFASSSSIYGSSNTVPFSEDDSPALPISPYAVTKLAGENFCFTYAHLYGIEIACLRFFTVYGPRQRPDMAIRRFTEAVLTDGVITIYGDGTASRDFTYVEDIVGGIVAALEHPCRYDVFNLGNSHTIDMNSVVRVIEAAVGRKAAVRHVAPEAGDMHTTCADIRKAKALLRYEPTTSFAEGIRKVVKWRRAFAAIA